MNWWESLVAIVLSFLVEIEWKELLFVVVGCYVFQSILCAIRRGFRESTKEIVEALDEVKKASRGVYCHHCEDHHYYSVQQCKREQKEKESSRWV